VDSAFPRRLDVALSIVPDGISAYTKDLTMHHHINGDDADRKASPVPGLLMSSVIIYILIEIIYLNKIVTKLRDTRMEHITFARILFLSCKIMA